MRKDQKMPEAVKMKLRLVNLGKRTSPETRAKLSALRRGKKRGPMSLGQREKLRIANLGKKQSPESIAKTAAANRGRRAWNKGKKMYFSPEHRAKLSIAERGEKNHRFGKRASEETRAKMRASHKLWRQSCPEIAQRKSLQMVGSGNPHWLGGISFDPYGIEFTKELCNRIRELDKCVCAICKLPSINGRLPVHHIDYNKKNNDETNLIALCRPCHIKTNMNRVYWMEELSDLLTRHRGRKIIGIGECA